MTSSSNRNGDLNQCKPASISPTPPLMERINDKGGRPIGFANAPAGEQSTMLSEQQDQIGGGISYLDEEKIILYTDMDTLTTSWVSGYQITINIRSAHFGKR